MTKCYKKRSRSFPHRGVKGGSVVREREMEGRVQGGARKERPKADRGNLGNHCRLNKDVATRTLTPGKSFFNQAQEWKGGDRVGEREERSRYGIKGGRKFQD